MHYYKRNLGDYAKKAGRLSMLQHGAYTLLIDTCYDREQFPTRDEAIEWTWASSTAEIEAVEFVLRKFFLLEDGVYVQKRIQEEIEEYQAKAETNKRIAIRREEDRRKKNTSRAPVVKDGESKNTHGLQIVDEPPPNHKPRTTNHKPITNIALAATRANRSAQVNQKKHVDDFFCDEVYLKTIKTLRPELEPTAEAMKLTFLVFWREREPIRDDWLEQWIKWVRAEKTNQKQID